MDTQQMEISLYCKVFSYAEPKEMTIPVEIPARVDEEMKSEIQKLVRMNFEAALGNTKGKEVEAQERHCKEKITHQSDFEVIKKNLANAMNSLVNRLESTKKEFEDRSAAVN